MRTNNLRVGVIGKDGRTSAIERSLRDSPRLGKKDEDLIHLSAWKDEEPENAMTTVLRRAREEKPDFVIVGPEEPLAAGVVDALQAIGIPCIGPLQSLAKLESSKAFTRALVSKYNIPGNPEYRVFENINGIEEYLIKLGEYVIKPDGLTGGKGVKISNSHLFSVEDALNYCRELFNQQPPASVLVEEKLDGEEFSLQSFCDGSHVVDMPVVQDHKRAGEGDTGPNTGGMGSYSCADHSLPFLLPHHLEEASAINKAVARALLEETGKKFKGILYGGFMVTRNGIRLLEYNARFGDPETLNVLSLLKTDFIDVCEAIIDEKLNELPIVFEKRATVCKYIVPNGYPENPVKGRLIDISKVSKKHFKKLRMYYASVEAKGDELYLTGSRGIAFVGIGQDLDEAQAIAEEAASAVVGPVFYRRDIGTHELIQHRIAHMRSLELKNIPKLQVPRDL